MVRLAPDVFVEESMVLAVQFKNAIWGRDPDSKILVGTVHKATCTITMYYGGTVTFQLGDDQRPEDVLEALGASEADEDDEEHDPDDDECPCCS